MEKFELNETPWEEVLLERFKQINNIVVTTKCNINCVFCSRKYNPFKCKPFDRSFNDIKAQLRLLNPNSEVYINSSISRLTDGEPFSYPRIWDVLSLIRKNLPFYDTGRLTRKISITTNGTLLTDSALKKLEDLKGVIIVHSINSTDLKDYMKLSQTSEKVAEISTTVPKRIKNFNITYAAGIVAMPNVVGFDGIENTLRDLDDQNVKHTRVFLPTYTKYASEEEQKMLHCDKEKLYSFINKLKNKLDMKILFYPNEFSDLRPNLKGYEYLGINTSDEILSVDDIKPFSRFHAQELLLNSTKRAHIVKLKNEKGDIRKSLILSKNIKLDNYINTRLNQDFPNVTHIIENAIKDHKKILVVHSQVAETVVKEAFRKIKELAFAGGKEFYFQTAYNDFYGGSVVCAGLLTCQDYKKYIKEFIDKNFKPDVVLVSDNAFDVLGRDLLKKSIYDVIDELGVHIELISIYRARK